MPSFFAFQQGTESRLPTSESSPLLGRFRAVPDAQRRARRSNSGGFLGSLTGGRGLGSRYSLVFGVAGAGGDDSDEGDLVDGEEMGALKRWGRMQRDLWLEPKQAVVARVVDRWWTRWAVLAVLPAVLVSGASSFVVWIWGGMEEME